MNRPTPDTVRQFASQTQHVNVSDRPIIERILPLEETRDYLLGLLVGLRIACEATDLQQQVLGKVVAVLAERVQVTPALATKFVTCSEFSEVLARDLAAELEAHSSAIASYTADTCPGVVRNRSEAISVSRALIARTSTYLRPADYGLLTAQLNDLDTALTTASQLAAGNRAHATRTLSRD